jgi:hypothetical protein
MMEERTRNILQCTKNTNHRLYTSKDSHIEYNIVSHLFGFGHMSVGGK